MVFVGILCLWWAAPNNWLAVILFKRKLVDVTAYCLYYLIQKSVCDYIKINKSFHRHLHACMNGDGERQRERESKCGECGRTECWSVKFNEILTLSEADICQKCGDKMIASACIPWYVVKTKLSQYKQPHFGGGNFAFASGKWQIWRALLCSCTQFVHAYRPPTLFNQIKKACWNNSAERYPSEIFDIPISRSKLSYSVFNWFFVLFYSNLLMNFSIISFTVISGRPWSRFDVVSFWLQFFTIFHLIFHSFLSSTEKKCFHLAWNMKLRQ